MIDVITCHMDEKCYVYTKNGSSVVIDPGINPNLISILKEKEYHIKAVLLTHGHYDHIAAVNSVCVEFNVPLYINKNEESFLYNKDLNLSTFFQKSFELSNQIEVCLFQDEESVFIGKNMISFIETSGHTSGSSVIAIGNSLFTGDTLFKGSIGRCDFPTGNQRLMRESLQKIMKRFDKKSIIYPGHGEKSTIQEEMKNNPYL